MVAWDVLKRDEKHLYVRAHYPDGTSQNVRMSATRTTDDEIKAALVVIERNVCYHPELGDALEKVLSSVGITEERVSKVLGRPCGCKKRKDTLNRLSRFAKDTVKRWFGGGEQSDLPTMVAVAGPNRSGTSCVAGMLHKLGVSMGHKFIQADDKNPMGYYEAKKLQKFLHQTRIKDYPEEECEQWFRRWANRRREANTVGCKHPGLCLVLPAMAKVWPRLKVISVNRPITDSMASLELAGWGATRRRPLQEYYDRRDADISRLRLPTLNLDYHRVLQNPAEVVDEIIKFLGITPTEEQRQAAIAHVTPELCHINSPVEQKPIVQQSTGPLVDVVYPLSNGSRWANNELRYSLRSLEKYAQNLGRVFIVTDTLPEWIQNVVHVPVNDTRGRNKDANIIDKLRAAIKAGISERFIFASDDQYLVAQVDLNTLPVTHGAMEGSNSTKWRSRLARTEERLSEQSFPTRFYDTHLFQPHLASQFEKAVSNEDYQTNPGYTVNTLAFNKYDPPVESVPCGKLRGSVMRNVNDTSVPKEARARYALHLPTPSRFEKPVILEASK